MIYGLIFTHWLADFVCQTDEMAKNKSKSNFWLGYHVLVYGGVLWAFCIADLIMHGDRFEVHAAFTVINVLIHFSIDFVTSRVTSKLWAKGEVHNFFVVVGFDQALHMATLYFTYQLLLA